MWTAIFAVVGEVVKFLCKWGMEWLDQDKERKKEKKEVRDNVIKKAKTQRERILGICRYNRI